MLVLEGLDEIRRADLDARHGPDSPESRSATLVGVFDGVHLGHQRLLQQLLEMAAELQSTPTIVTFANHPDELLRGLRPDWIVSLPHRLRLLRRAGIRRVALLYFDDALRGMNAETFTRDVLVSLGTRGLLLGHDGAIGKDREGTFPRMTELGAHFGFDVRQGEALEIEGRPVSSTSIRAAIRDGRLQDAQRLLGRWPAAFGEVVEGDKRGRRLGFPTANVVAQSLVLPPPGVHAVEVLHDGTPYPGVANLGARPTFDDSAPAADEPPRLEVHLFEFEDNLYGATLEVQFVARIRAERKFSGLEELKGADRCRCGDGR